MTSLSDSQIKKAILLLVMWPSWRYRIMGIIFFIPLFSIFVLRLFQHLVEYYSKKTLKRIKVNKNSSQVNFIQFVLLPLFHALAKLFPQMHVSKKKYGDAGD